MTCRGDITSSLLFIPPPEIPSKRSFPMTRNNPSPYFRFTFAPTPCRDDDIIIYFIYDRYFHRYERQRLIVFRTRVSPSRGIGACPKAGPGHRVVLNLRRWRVGCLDRCPPLGAAYPSARRHGSRNGP